MIRTRVTQTLALPAFVPGGKLGHAYRGLLPVWMLCAAMAAWSQTAPGFSGPRRPTIMSGAVPSAQPAADTPASAQYRFITIGVPGSADAQAYAINDAGLVTGFYEDASSNYHGFVWQAGSFQTVDYPGAAYTYLFATNGHGVVIGFYGNGTTNHAVTYSVQSGTWTALPDIPGYSANQGYGINDAGAAVGNAYQGSTNIAWIWEPTTHSYYAMDVPGAAQYSTEPNAINDKGEAVGYFADTSGVYHGFLEQGNTYTTIDAPGATDTFAYGINNGGTIVGEWNDAAGAPQGFILTSGGLFTAVDYPGPEGTALEGINERGDISGAYVENPSGSLKAFIALRR